MTRSKTKKSAPAAEVSKGGESETQPCATCQKDVVDACIGCDSCERWVHDTEMCSGLPQKLIDAIAEHDGAGISFYCTLCRITRQKASSSSSSQSQGPMIELIMQLFQQIQGVCANLQALTDQVKNLSSPVTMGLPAAPTAPAPAPPAHSSVMPQTSTEYRATIREEIREIAERDKRKQSIIIKGLNAGTPRDLALKFKRLTSEVMDRSVEVTEVTAIPNHSQIFRAKITDEDCRTFVLEKAKSLKDTEEYRHVYISRDLTYAQRTALFNKRKARKNEHAQNVKGGTPQSADGGPESAPSTQVKTGEAASSAAAPKKN